MAGAERVLLDASALLALAQNDLGADRVRAIIPFAAISALSVAECIAVLSRFTGARTAALCISRLGLSVISCDWETAIGAAELHAATRDMGLSLADCVCLATARRLGITALTANRAWADLDVGVAIEILR